MTTSSPPARAGLTAAGDGTPETLVRQLVRRVLSSYFPRGSLQERRRDPRYPFPHLVTLVPIDSRGRPVDCPLVAAGKYLSEGGLGVFHPQPLTFRRAIATLEVLARDGGEAYRAMNARGERLMTGLRDIARRHGLPLLRALRCRRAAAAQHALSRAERLRNVTDLFVLRRCDLPDRVLLVDDLLTSAATATAAARVLRNGGARHIHLLALARTPTPAERAALPARVSA